MAGKAQHDRARARVGTTVGKYALDGLLGAGGMASVFAATHVRNRSRAALKVLHTELMQRADIRRRFVGEGYVANKIGHPAVVRILDDDVDEQGCPYLVMELLEGMTLDADRENAGGKLPPDEAIGVTCALLDVLHAAHNAGVVHRDVKPENVFVLRDGTIKLMDFGIARLLDGSNATRTGALMGTPAFMAPEQAGGRTRDVDARTDIWSVGATLFFLLTGEEVHPAQHEQLQLIHAATQPARSITKVAPSTPPELAVVVDAALAFDRSARWQTAAGMRDALTRAAAAGQVAVAPTLRPRLKLVPSEDDAHSAGPTKIFGSGSSSDER